MEDLMAPMTAEELAAAFTAYFRPCEDVVETDDDYAFFPQE
jgi:hypothetical protein